MSAWTEEIIAELTEMWPEKGGSEIANALTEKYGNCIGEFTRNAVLGKAHRLGLMSKEKPKNKTPEEKAKCVPMKYRGEKSPPRSRGKTRFDAEPAIPPAPWEPNRTIVCCPDPVSLYPFDGPTIPRSKCRWPLWCEGWPAEDRPFCGNKTVDGDSYCAAHAAIAYQPVKDIRSKRTKLWRGVV